LLHGGFHVAGFPGKTPGEQEFGAGAGVVFERVECPDQTRDVLARVDGTGVKKVVPSGGKFGANRLFFRLPKAAGSLPGCRCVPR
jgi:hypothetical protein